MARAILEVFLGAKTDQFRKEINEAKRTVNELKEQVGALAPTLGEAFTVAGIAALGYEAVRTGAEIYDMSRRLGLSTDATQKLSYAAKVSGTDIEVLAKAVQKAQATLHEGGNPAMIKGFETLNLKIEEMQGLTPDQFIIKLGEAFKSTKDHGDAMAGMIGVLGAKNSALAGEIENVAEALKNAPMIISADSIVRMKQLSDELERMKPLWMEIGVAVATFGKYVLNTLMGIQSLSVAMFMAPIQMTKGLMAGESPIAVMKKQLGYLKNEFDRIMEGYSSPKLPTDAAKFGNTGTNPKDAEAIAAQKEADREREKTIKEIVQLEKEIAKIRQETADIGKSDAEKRKELEEVIAAAETKKAQIEVATKYSGMTPEEAKKEKARIENSRDPKLKFESDAAFEAWKTSGMPNSGPEFDDFKNKKDKWLDSGATGKIEDVDKARRDFANSTPEQTKKAADTLTLEAVNAKKKLAEMDRSERKKAEEHQQHMTKLNDELADKQEKLDFSHLDKAEKIKALKQKELDLLNEASKAFDAGDMEKGQKLRIKGIDVHKELEDLQKPQRAESHIFTNSIRQMGGVGADTRIVTSGMSPIKLQETANKHLEKMAAKLDKLDKIETNTRKGAGWQ